MDAFSEAEKAAVEEAARQFGSTAQPEPSTDIRDLPGIDDLGPNASKLGDCISWKAPKEVPLQELRAAMAAEGIDEKIIKELKARNAFVRACRKMQDERVIRKVMENETELKFQFTKEFLQGSDLEYLKEEALVVCKDTGVITAERDPAFAEEAQKLLNECSGVRTGADINRMIQKVFSENGSIYPIREEGGAYFVPSQYEGMVDKFENLLLRIGGKMRRLMIPVSPKNKSNVIDVVKEGTQQIIEEFKNTIEAYSDTAAPGHVENCLKRIRTQEAKCEAMKELLGVQLFDLEEGFDHCKKLLDKKIHELISAKQAS